MRSFPGRTPFDGDTKISAPDLAQQTVRLLDRLDAAFMQVLAGRYGGGIDLSIVAATGGTSTRTLRAAESPDRLGIVIQPEYGAAADSQGQGFPFGTIRLGPTGPADITVTTEIFALHDPNEPSDAATLGTGVLFAPMPDQLPGGAAGCGLGLVRTREAASAGASQARQMQRGWLARQRRQNQNGALGLGSSGHHRATSSSTIIPVSAELLERIGAAIAEFCAAGPATPAGQATLILQIGPVEAP